MKRFKKILVATDTRLDKHPIVAEAAEIARHNGASLKIVDVVPEFSWTVRLTLKDHEHMLELIETEKQQNLETLAAPLRDQGINVQTKVLSGKTSVEIIREVLRAKHDLVLRVAKGHDSRRGGFFGNTGIRLLRDCPCPVWLVTPVTDPQFNHVLGCVETSSGDPVDAEINDKVYELASSISQYHGGRFSIVHAYSTYGERILKHRMQPDEFDEVTKRNYEQAARLLDEFLEKHGSSFPNDDVHLLQGDPPTAIPEFIQQHGVDLVVMGTVGRSGLLGMIVGNTAEQILNNIECSVLALKPSSFKCPISLSD